LKSLLAMSPAELEKVDIAAMNLLCALGLPGAENLRVPHALATLDLWAKRVRYWTEQSLPDFRSRPQDFRNSEASFRALLLISVMQKDFGVHYNERGERNVDFSNSKNPFIHGMIDDPNGGTCASMPVLYVAVGRRLGYPLKLVPAKTHLFARWESPDGKERFNVEGTAERFSYHPDSYYQNWPYPISDDELRTTWYLKSLTPAEELAVFLQNRAHCLLDSNRIPEAKAAFVAASRLARRDPLRETNIAYATELETGALARGRAQRLRTAGPRVPVFDADIWPSRQNPNRYDPMAAFGKVQAINEQNRRMLERQTRPAMSPSPFASPPAFPAPPGYP
jgi:hypothetical protein